MLESQPRMKKTNRLRPVLLLSFSAAFFLASWLVANVSIGESVTWVSALFIFILALPSYYFLVKWLPTSKALMVLLLFSVFPIVIEAIGISTGLPYGGFHYSDEMGFKILGIVPWSVSLAFAPLILGSATVTNRQIEDSRLALPVSALLLVMFDLILDPAAVSLNIWVWDVPGPYYGIPISNYAGWFLTGLVAAALLHVILMETPVRTVRLPADLAISLLLIISFWTGFSFWTSLLVPAAIGLVMMTYLVYVIGSA